MTATSVENVNPPTPWEFLPDDDDERPVQNLAAEDAALHIETVGWRQPQVADEPVTVHYLEDEVPEVPDVTQPIERFDETADCAALLTRQHYFPPIYD